MLPSLSGDYPKASWEVLSPVSPLSPQGFFIACRTEPHRCTDRLVPVVTSDTGRSFLWRH
jgi:hypothetical protein